MSGAQSGRRRRRYTLQIHPLALDNVLAIESYIAQRNATAAGTYADAIMAALLTVHHRPFSHGLAPTRLHRGIRQRLVGSHRIVFGVRRSIVTVFRVLHQREAIERLAGSAVVTGSR